jgi:hypothetical protein
MEIDVREAGRFSPGDPYVLFTAGGMGVTVNGELVTVYDFPSVHAAETEASFVHGSGDRIEFPPCGVTGTLRGSTINWGPHAPHFYRKGRVIAVYAGTDAEVKAALRTILGDVFAGCGGLEGCWR